METELTHFLLARIAEDEAAIQTGWSRGVLDPDASNIEKRWHRARVLAECEAKRRIVASRPLPVGRDWNLVRAWCDGVLQALALPYADHPDFQQEWRA